jgi:PDZ domain-containing protein
LGLVALLTRAAPQDGCGAVVSTQLLAARIAERLCTPVIPLEVDRHGLRSVAPGTDTLLLFGPRCVDRGDPLGGDVVVCLDGSVRAEAVLPVAVEWARAFAVDLWLLSAASPRDGVHAGDLLQSSYLARAVAAVGGPSAVTGWDVLHGAPVAALVDHVRHTRAGLIALNSHGTATSARAAYGRVPARLVLESPVPVLLARAREEPAVVRTHQPPRPPVPRPRAVPRPRSDGDRLAVAARSYLTVATPLRVPLRRRPRWSRRRIAALVVAIALACGAFSTRVSLPYHRLGGTTRPATELVSVPGVPADRAGGDFLVTIVTAEPVTIAGALGAWLDHRDIQRDPDPTLVTSARWTNRRLMDEAGETATAVALHHLGLDERAVRVAFTPHGLGGPSAGLAMALELVDLLSPGDLTGGRRVAVSGALAPDGRVGAVGGIRYKTVAALRAGADVLLVPPQVAPEARRFAGPMLVIPVASFTDALAALRYF